jgi:hypothetical protein
VAILGKKDNNLTREVAMIEIAEHNHIHQQCREFNQELVQNLMELSKMRAHRIWVLFGLPGIVFAVARQNRASQKIIQRVRETFDRCQWGCIGSEDEAGCMKMLTGLVSETRDRYANLEENAAHVPIVRTLLGRSIRNTLIDWDDLVEDLTIGSDPEIRDLLSKIAQAA